ncbi:MAG: biosynthetic arginine decarboxylase [Thiohalomonadales bacterium]
MKQKTDWNINSARELYNIRAWGQGFFDINNSGDVIALDPRYRDHPGIVLSEVVRSLQSQGVNFPVLLRFMDILHVRVEQLCASFSHSIAECAYQGRFYPVYPIKVNQEFSVVKSIVNHPTYSVGLEAGSKTELLAILSIIPNNRESENDPPTPENNNPNNNLNNNASIVCNGYKDREYVRLALICERLGYRTFIVLEKLSELALVLSQAEELAVRPRLGIRIKLNASGHGAWQNTGGDKSKFGLSASEVLSVVNTLKAQNHIEQLQLLHFHLGSQIPNIDYIEQATLESAQYLNQLHQIGCRISVIDVGGGLGIDYEGSQSSNDFSINYGFKHYAERIVTTLASVCNQYNIPHPDIFTESGRAMTAHHTVLISNVIEAESSDDDNSSDPTPLNCPELEQLDQLCRDVNNGLRSRLNDTYKQANYLLMQAQALFRKGDRNIEQRAYSEKMYRAILANIQQKMDNSDSKNHLLADEINQKLAAKYFCNFSLFQSLPDIWALRQIFPIMPLQRLHERPLQNAVVRDITCDSDGRIDHYIAHGQIQQTISLHTTHEHETYLLGFFLVGAYQEILGDMHNLFGDTHSVNISFVDEGYVVEHIQSGDTAEYILNNVHFDTGIILKNIEGKIQSAMLNSKHAEEYFAEIKSALLGYSYLKPINSKNSN